MSMRRRTFIAGLGSAAAWVAVAPAQQAIPVIGYLTSRSDDEHYTALFLQGLKETAFVEGQNVAIEYSRAEDHADRLPALAADLVRRRVAVIVASGTPATLAAKAATATIPIVFSTGGDPVALGLVASLNRPGTNLAGTANFAGELAPKRLQLLHELIPNAAAFGALVDPAFPNTQSTVAELQAAARTLGLQLVIVCRLTRDSVVSAARNRPSDAKSAAPVSGLAEPFPGGILSPEQRPVRMSAETGSRGITWRLAAPRVKRDESEEPDGLRVGHAAPRTSCL